MSDGFGTRLTHALLMAIIVLLCLADSRPMMGDVWKPIHALGIVIYCFLWAWGWPNLRAWLERKTHTTERET